MATDLATDFIFELLLSFFLRQESTGVDVQFHRLSSVERTPPSEP